jgi:hypothetical protein
MGFGNQVMAPDNEKMHNFRSFEDIMRRILPPTLGFRSLQIRAPEVVLSTQTGEFLLDAVSGGIGALLDLAWQIFVCDPTRSRRLTVLIDEVENHLHASMQRTVMPNLLEAFPNVQFIVTTHSPLVVGSVRNSSVYALVYNEQQRVESRQLNLDSRAGTAAEILRDVLGVPVTAPVWVEQYLTDLAARYQERSPSNDQILELRSELVSAGLEEFAPQTIADLLGRWERKS